MQADIKQFMQVDYQQLKDRQHLRQNEAALYLAIAPSTLWLYVRRGWIKSIKLSPKVTVFAVADLDAFVQSRMSA